MLGWWYRKSAVFYLPPGWMGPVTWFLSLPFAPAGMLRFKTITTFCVITHFVLRVCKLRCLADGMQTCYQGRGTGGEGLHK